MTPTDDQSTAHDSVSPSIVSAEDDSALRTMMMEILERAGFDLISVNDRLEAGDSAQRGTPHALIVDVMLQSDNGLEAISAIQLDPARRSAPAAATGRPDVSERPGRHGMEIETFMQLVERNLARCLDGEPARISEWIDFPSGQHFIDVRLRQQLRDTGEVIGAAICVRNQTEQKLMEEAFATSEARLAEAEKLANLAYFERDLSGHTAWWSPAIYSILGLDPDDADSTPRALVSMAHPEDQARVVEDLERFEHSREHQATEFRIVRPDGSERTLAVSYRFDETETGMKKLRGMVQDVTERKQAEEETHQLQIQLRQAQKMETIGQLTGEFAHDFNNILAIVTGHADLARTRRLGRAEPVDRSLDEIAVAAGRGSSLISKMLAFSRGRAVKHEALDLADVTERLLAVVSSTLPTSIRLNTSFAPNLPPVLADSVQLEQILWNLIVNSKDAIDEVGLIEVGLTYVQEVDVSCTSCSRPIEGSAVVLSVGDSGGGVAPEVRDRMFEPFVSSKPDVKGTGLGLSVVHGISHEFGGHVVVGTSPAGGAEFRIHLPPTNVQIAPPVTAGEEPDIVAHRSATILVVDDESAILDVLSESLESDGYDVIAFDQSERAMSAFLADPGKFDLILTDQTMPVLTGSQLSQRVRAVRPDVPILLCSGYFDSSSDRRAPDHESILRLKKPMNVSQLLRTISDVLGESTNAARSSG